MKSLILVFAFLAIAVATVPVTHFLYGTSGQEVVYTYYADVRTSVQSQEHSSQFVFKADLHLRIDPSGNGTIAYFVSPSIYVYNGELSERGYTINHEIPHQEFVPITKESESILKPFYITYDQIGFIHEIFTQHDDQEWSVNIKKGVASVLQLDLAEIYKHPHQKPFAFHTEEHTTFGKVNMTYAVVPHGEKYLISKTLTDYHQMHDYPYETFPNFDVEHNHHHTEDYKITSTEFVYQITKTKDAHIVHRIDSYAIKALMPFANKGARFSVNTNQTFVYVGLVKPETPVDVATLNVYHPLIYSHVEKNVENYFPDVSVFHRKIDIDIVAPKVQAMLYEAYEYLQKEQITKTEVDTKHGLTISRIVKALKYFSVDNYEQFYVFLTKTTTPKDLHVVDLFYKILPTVGTKSSTLFIRNLIKKHKVKDFVAAGMLYSLGSNVRIPHVDLLKELEEFTHFEDEVKPEVSHAAILTYGTLVYRTFKHEPTHPQLEKYIKVYYNKLKEAKTYEDQLTWLLGLRNIQIGSVHQLLVPIAHGEQVFSLPYDRHLQLHAIYSFIKIYSQDPQYLFDVCWPIYVDKSLHTQLRIAAVKAILETHNINYYSKIFWHMSQELNPHVYSFYYTYVKHLATSTIYDYSRFETYVSEMAKFYKHFATQVSTQAFYYDYVDHEQDFGGSVTGYMTASEKTNNLDQFYVQFSPYVMNNHINLYALHVKFEGVENPLTSLLPGIMSFKPDLFKTNPIQKHEQIPVHVEITLLANGKVVYTKYFNEETFKTFYTHTYLSILSTIKYQVTNVLNVVQAEMYVPTILGIPAVYHMHIPVVTQFKYDVTVPTSDPAEHVLKVATQLRYWIRGTYGVAVYNPFAATWHGARRVNSIDANIPLYYDIAFNFAQSTIKLTLEKSLTESYNVLGLKTHVKTQFYARPESDIDYLKSTCPKCHQYVTPTYGQKYKQPNVVIYESHAKSVGLHYYFGLYDVEVTPDTKVYTSLSEFLVQPLFKKIPTMPVHKFFMTYYTWFMTTFLPQQYPSYGVVLYQHPCHYYPVEKTEVVLKFDHEPLEHGKWTTPATKLNMRFSVTFKGVQDKILNHWDANIVAHHHQGIYLKDIHVHATRKTPGEKNLNVCFNWDKTVSKETVTGGFHYYLGYSHDHQCVKDDFSVSVEYYGTHSEDQKNYTYDPVYTYKECQPHMHEFEGYPVSFECAVAHTSLRKYVYDVDYHNVPLYYKHIFGSVWQFFRHTFASHYDYEPHHHVSSNSFKVDVEYPVYYEEPHVNYVFTFPDGSHVFEHVPYYDFVATFQPDNAYFTRYFKFMKTLGLVHSCATYPVETVSHVEKQYYHVPQAPVPNQWTLYASDKPTDYTWAIYVQKVKEQYIALKVVLNGHVIYVQPPHETSVPGSKYSFIVDDQLMHYMQTSYDVDDMYSFKLFQVNDTVLFTIPHVSLYVTYDKHHVVVEVPKEQQVTYYGLCFA